MSTVKKIGADTPIFSLVANFPAPKESADANSLVIVLHAVIRRFLCDMNVVRMTLP